MSFNLVMSKGSLKHAENTNIVELDLGKLFLYLHNKSTPSVSETGCYFFCSVLLSGDKIYVQTVLISPCCERAISIKKPAAQRRIDCSIHSFSLHLEQDLSLDVTLGLTIRFSAIFSFSQKSLRP